MKFSGGNDGKTYMWKHEPEEYEIKRTEPLLETVAVHRVQVATVKAGFYEGG